MAPSRVSTAWSVASVTPETTPSTGVPVFVVALTAPVTSWVRPLTALVPVVARLVTTSPPGVMVLGDLTGVGGAGRGRGAAVAPAGGMLPAVFSAARAWARQLGFRGGEVGLHRGDVGGGLGDRAGQQSVEVGGAGAGGQGLGTVTVSVGPQVPHRTWACSSSWARVSADWSTSSALALSVPMSWRDFMPEAVNSRTEVMSLGSVPPAYARKSRSAPSLAVVRKSLSASATSALSSPDRRWSSLDLGETGVGLGEQRAAPARVAHVHGRGDVLDAALDRVERLAGQCARRGRGHAGGAADDDQGGGHGAETALAGVAEGVRRRAVGDRGGGDELGLGGEHQALPEVGDEVGPGLTSGFPRRISTVPSRSAWRSAPELLAREDAVELLGCSVREEGSHAWGPEV